MIKNSHREPEKGFISKISPDLLSIQILFTFEYSFTLKYRGDLDGQFWNSDIYLSIFFVGNMADKQ